MSLLFAATIAASQLCYNADADVGANDFLKNAQVFHAQLIAMSEEKKSGCIDITSKEALEEAKALVKADSTQETLSIKQ